MEIIKFDKPPYSFFIMSRKRCLESDSMDMDTDTHLEISYNKKCKINNQCSVEFDLEYQKRYMISTNEELAKFVRRSVEIMRVQHEKLLAKDIEISRLRETIKNISG